MANSTISAHQGGATQNWPSEWGTSGTLGIYATQSFVADDGKAWDAGDGESLNGNFVAKATISVTSNVPTYAAFTLPQTDLASPQNVVRYYGRIFDSNGTPRNYHFEDFHLKSTLGSSISYLAWWNDNQQVYRGQLDSVPTTAQMNLAIAAAINAPASTTQNGIGEVSVNPADTSHPIFVGDNDLRVGKDSADYASLSAAVTAIGSTATDLFITSTFASGASTTVPSTLRLRFMAGGSIVLGSGHTVIVRSDISGWPVRQIFSGSGVVSFSGSPAFVEVWSEWWGAVADNSTVSASAINAAHVAISTASRGRLKLVAGSYYVGSTFNASIGGVIGPPQQAWTGGLNQTYINYEIVGGCQPSWGDYGFLGTGTIIRSDAVGSGTLPAIYTAGLYSASYADANWNYVDVSIKNVLFRATDNPTLGGVSLWQARRASVENVNCDVGVRETVGSSTACADPTHDCVGIQMPKSANNGQANVTNCTVTGFKFGFGGSDHFRTSGFVMAARCKYASTFTDAAGFVSGTLYSYRCLHDFFMVGSINVVNLQLQSEVDNTSGTWTQRTVGVTVDWYDDANITHGSIWHLMETPDGLHTNYTPTVTGFDFTDKTTTYNGKPSTFTHFFTGAGVLVNPSHGVMDSAQIGGGGTVTVTLTGGAVFTSDTTYQVVGTNVTNANAFKIAKVSGTQFTITGTAADRIAYIATGN